MFPTRGCFTATNCNSSRTLGFNSMLEVNQRVLPKDVTFRSYNYTVLAWKLSRLRPQDQGSLTFLVFKDKGWILVWGGFNWNQTFYLWRAKAETPGSSHFSILCLLVSSLSSVLLPAIWKMISARHLEGYHNSLKCSWRREERGARGEFFRRPWR